MFSAHLGTRTVGAVLGGVLFFGSSVSCGTKAGSEDAARTANDSSESVLSTDLPAAVAATADVCSLLTSEEVATATGGAVTETVPTEDNISTCVWKLGPDHEFSVMASVQTDPDLAFGPRSLFKDARADDEAVPVAVGDEATFVAAFQAVYLRSGGKYAVVLLNGAIQPEPEAILVPLAATLADRL